MYAINLKAQLSSRRLYKCYVFHTDNVLNCVDAVLLVLLDDVNMYNKVCGHCWTVVVMLLYIPLCMLRIPPG